MLGIVHNASLMKKKHSILPNILICLYLYKIYRYIHTNMLNIFLINKKIKCNMQIEKHTDSKLFTVNKLL